MLGTHKHTMAEWESRVGGMKLTRMRYGLCHPFIPLTVEGDEVYPVVGQRVNPADAIGWAALMLEPGQPVSGGSAGRPPRRHAV